MAQSDGVDLPHRRTRALPQYSCGSIAPLMSMRPTRHAVVFFLILGAMLLASVNYQSNAAWLMVFLVLTTGGMSAVHGLRNVLPATVIPADTPLVAAGDRARLVVTVGNRASRELFALVIEIPKAAYKPELMQVCEQHQLLIPHVEPQGSARGEFVLPAFPRGVHRITQLALSSQYPLGLFRILRLVTVSLDVSVHPAPAGISLAQMPQDLAAGQGQRGAVNPHEQDDFRGLRPWQLGESYRQVDWKSAARTDGPLQLKDFAGGGAEVTWLSWGATVGGHEQRLSQLAKWVIEAHQAGLCYGLRLPQTEITPSTGTPHYQDCLRALAHYEPGLHASGRLPAVTAPSASGARPGSSASVSGLQRSIVKPTGHS